MWLSNNFLKLLEGLRRSFSPLVLGILDFPAHQFSWCTCNTKATRWNHRLTPHPHFLDRELIHWTDKTENMWKIVGQLPIKAGWWDASLTFKRFSQSIANTPNYKIAKLSLLSLPSLVLTKKFTSELPSWYMFCPPRKQTRTFAVELGCANQWATDT